MTPDPEIRMVLGRRLRAIRRCRGMTLKAVAQIAGVRMQQIQKYETGEHNLTVPRLLAVARALHQRPGDLIGGLEELT